VRILTVSHFYENHGGGIERVAAQLCRQFSKSGHHAVWAASAADPAPTDVNALPLRCTDPLEARMGLPMPIPRARAIRALGRAIRDCDVVIVHDALYLTSVLGMFLGKLHGKPIVLVQHIASIEFANAVMRGLMRLANCLVTKPMLHAADRLVFISDSVRRDLLGESAHGNFLLLFNGVDTKIFRSRDASTRCAVRAAFGLPIESRIALFVGRFVEKKGLAVLKALARRRPDLHFALVGGGPVRPEMWGLSNIHVLGPQPQEKIAELYAAPDLLLLPSVGEGFPLVIQEAMASGLPVVCGESSSHADPAAAQWLRGVAIDLSDPEGSAARCSAAIDGLFADPPDRAAMARYAEETYNWPAMARGILRTLSRLEPVDCAAGRYQPG
jgi:glycosyltransferase involved in cell wall biosynthesis